MAGSYRRRGGPKRPAKKRQPAHPLLYVVCEGKETEPRYLREILQATGLPSERVVIEGGSGTGGSLLDKAKRMLRAREQRDGYSRDELWIVFDDDERYATGELDRLFEAEKSMPGSRGLVVRTAFSRPDVELWFLLHLEERPGPLKLGEALSRLRARVPQYSKSGPIYGPGSPLVKYLSAQHEGMGPERSLEVACLRAESLRAYHDASGSRDGQRSNPSTTLDLLVVRIRGLR